MLARRALERFGDRVEIVSSLAGVTEEPRRPPGAVRIGGFGGVDGLRRHLERERVAALIDATHPFAARMQANAAEACALANVARCRLLRPEWTRQPGDRWIEVGSAAEAAGALRELGPRIFLALGARDLPAFAGLSGKWLLLRGINPPPTPIGHGEFLRARGPFALQDEEALLRQHRVDAIVSRQSGGSGAGAKIEAARRLGLPVVMIRRPPPPPPPHAATVEAALSWLADQISAMGIRPLARTPPADAV